MSKEQTRVELLNYGRDGEITLIESPVKRRRVMQLLPGQDQDGYGQKITTDWVVNYKGKMRRVYCTQVSNAGTCWFLHEGKQMIVG